MASLWVAIFQLAFGKKAVDLVLYWLIGLAGFTLGQIAAEIAGSSILMIGDLHALEASVVCWAAMAIARRLRA